MATILMLTTNNIIKTLTGILQDEGHRPFQYGRQGALDFLASQVDLVILDVWLPDIDGIGSSAVSRG